MNVQNSIVARGLSTFSGGHFWTQQLDIKSEWKVQPNSFFHRRTI